MTQNAGDRQRMYRYQRYKIPIQGQSACDKTSRNDQIVAKADTETLPKLLQRIVAGGGTLRHKYRAKLDNTCFSHTKYDNNNYARLPDTEIGESYKLIAFVSLR